MYSGLGGVVLTNCSLHVLHLINGQKANILGKMMEPDILGNMHIYTLCSKSFRKFCAAV